MWKGEPGATGLRVTSAEAPSRVGEMLPPPAGGSGGHPHVGSAARPPALRRVLGRSGKSSGLYREDLGREGKCGAGRQAAATVGPRLSLRLSCFASSSKAGITKDET